jgi:hypothetical protein
MLLSVVYGESFAITYTFTGSHNSDWSNALNWKSPAGKPGNVILKPHTIIIEATCSISQGMNIVNYGEIIVKNSCPCCDFHSICNYGKVVFEQTTFHQALGETFMNYASGVLILPVRSLQNFCHLENKGLTLEPDSFVKINVDELKKPCE